MKLIKSYFNEYEIDLCSTCQVELSTEDWDLITNHDKNWDKIIELASTHSPDSPDSIFYIEDNHLQHLKNENFFPDKIIQLFEYANSLGYDYIKLY